MSLTSDPDPYEHLVEGCADEREWAAAQHGAEVGRVRYVGRDHNGQPIYQRMSDLERVIHGAD